MTDDHPPIYPDEHGDWAAANRGAVPRRNRLDRCTPAELAIYAAMDAVEALPADVRLTEAVALLRQARERVADFVDGIAPSRKLKELPDD
jgi:hypothetical protein